jgi:hypothetical protein
MASRISKRTYDAGSPPQDDNNVSEQRFDQGILVGLISSFGLETLALN